MYLVLNYVITNPPQNEVTQKTVAIFFLIFETGSGWL